jgi:ATP-dependent DNA helicase RecQ
VDLRRDLLDLDAAVREHDAEGADGALTRLRDAWRAMDEEARPALAECIARIKEGLSPTEGDLTRIAGAHQPPARAEPASEAAQVLERARAAVAPRAGGEGRAEDPRDLTEVLTQLGVSELRPGQAEAIDAAMAGRDAIAVMATGSGKSLCYMAPGLALGGLTVVVSPLVALIADQHERLVRAGAPVRMLAGTLSPEANRESIADIRAGRVRIVLCAPERFASSEFVRACQANRVDLFVVDEAHCLVEWGDDFRPEYLRLPEWRDALGARATMALTASATPDAAERIESVLGLTSPARVRNGFDRPNISFEVQVEEGRGAGERRWARLLAALRAPEGLPAIVYTGTRRDAEQLAERISAEGIGARAYHAGLGERLRTAAQEDFMGGRAPVICATNAFGMGVDKADVRSVVHWGLPTSLEAYYQEAGRAGRDGGPARALLLAQRSDLGRLQRFIDRARVDVRAIDATLARLASRADASGAFLIPDQRALDDEERLRLALAARIGAMSLHPAPGGGLVGRLEAGRLEGELRARAALAVRTAESRRWAGYRAIDAYAFGGACPRARLLAHFGDPSACPPEGCAPERCRPLPPLPDPAPSSRRRTASASSGGGALDAVDPELRERLRAWRRERAGDNPAYTVCSDRTLAEIIVRRPATRDALAAVNGVGPAFLSRHADDLLALLAATPVVGGS